MLPKPEEGTVVITANQTAGRGQRGNTWIVEPGKNLTFSLLLKPTFLKVEEQFFLTIIISLAITDVLNKTRSHSPEELNKTQSPFSPGEEVGDEVKIKWPNDILINEKKICGILIENSLSQSGIQQTIVGIGLNVNQKSFSISTATSLYLVLGKEQELNSILNPLLENIEKRYLQLRNRKFAELKAEYLNRLFGKGEVRNFLIEEKQTIGKLLGVDELGRLVVEMNNQTYLFNNKEISFV